VLGAPSEAKEPDAKDGVGTVSHPHFPHEGETHVSYRESCSTVGAGGRVVCCRSLVWWSGGEGATRVGEEAQPDDGDPG
jgi:hypothetical protein